MILFCNCGYSDIIDNAIKDKILNRLANTELDFEVVQDLCELAANKDPKLKYWAKADSLTIVACYQRAIKWLFNAAGAELNPERTQFFNMRTSTAEQIISSLFSKEIPAKEKKKIQLEEKKDWTPWFPVIDYDRCENCMQCLNFCLFGVYELSQDGQVEVTNPASCKTNCPACARLCPHKAIIFPKYPDSHINGDKVDDSKKTNLTPDDIYEILKRRDKTKKRFEKDKANRQEIDLTKLKNKLGIPLEVLETLRPSEVTKLKEKSEKKTCE